MHKICKAIPICGFLSAAIGGTFLTSSFITFHPNIQAAVSRGMAILFGVWILLALLTLGLGFLAAASAEDSELKAGRALRKRGLWFSLPQIGLIVLFGVGALLSR